MSHIVGDPSEIPGTATSASASNPQPYVTVDYQPGKKRWSKVFHIFGISGGEAVLPQKDAIKISKEIMKIAKEEK